jgi:hypothetical protein
MILLGSARAGGYLRRAVPRVILLILVAAGLLAGTASASTNHWQRCGRADVNGYPDNPLRVRALGVTCKTAKGIARHHYRHIGDGEKCDLDRPKCVVLGFTCRRTFFGNSGTRVRCRGDNAYVKFIYGV